MPLPRHGALAIALSSAVVAGAWLVRSGGGHPLRVSSSGFEPVWALEELAEIELQLGDEARAALANAPREWVEATVVLRGQPLARVGVRLKGHRSMRPLDDKPSFKLSFDEYVKRRKVFGVRSVTLNNLVEDPTMMRELLAYRIHRAMGVPAPDVGYARVRVDGADYGLYAVIESVDEEFLERRFEDASGGLYEGEYGCDLSSDDVAGFDKDAGPKKDRADLEQLAARFEAGERLLAPGGPLGPDVIAYLAVSAFVGDFDGYRHAHNYRLYHDPARGRWSFVPWGLDRALKKPLPLYDSEGLVAKACFADAACRLEYARTLRRVADSVDRLELGTGMAVIGSVIDEAARQDTRRPYTLREIDAARVALTRFLRERPAQVRAQLGCLDEDGNELDRDGDGFGCLDCDDGDPTVHPGAAEVCDGRDVDCSGRIDDAPTCGCEAVAVDGVTYQLCDQPMPWTEAAAYCEELGLTLARVDGKSQTTALQQAALRRRDARWWIGLDDRAAEGAFAWRDGAPLGEVAWARGEPDNDACNQDCAALSDDGRGAWHDTHCGQHLPFVCR